MSEPPDALPQYALRFSERARNDLAAAQHYFTLVTDEETAAAWLEGLYESLTTLAASPYRSSMPEQNQFRVAVRQFIYRRRSGSVAYRVLFHVKEAGLEGPQVIILSVRHGAQSAITEHEARKIEEGQ